MGWFKQIIADIFNIHAEDIAPSGRHPQPKDLSPEITAKITDEVNRQIEATLANKMLPGIKKIIEEKFDEISGISTTQLQPASKDDIEPVAMEKDIYETIESDIENEYPIIDDQNFPEHTARETSQPDDDLTQIVEIEPEAEKEEHLDEVEAQEILPLEISVSEEIVEPIEPDLIPVTEKDIRLGIDFGTTTTAVSIKIDDELPEVLPIGLDGVTPYLPSVVHFQPGDRSLEERVIVGEEAESFGDQTRVIRSIKRCIGCHGNNCSKSDNVNRHFAWCLGDGKIQVTETEHMNPEEIAYYVVKEAIERAIRIVRDRLKIDLTNENITIIPLNMGCGTNYNYKQRSIVKKLAHKFGFSDLSIQNVVEEPILAGFTFSRFANDPYGKVLIYDFGGGTLDVAIEEVDRTESGLRVTVITTAGESWLGGDDIDGLVYQYFLEGVSRELDIAVDQVEKQLKAIERSRLLSLARQAKEQLSSSDMYKDVLFTEKLKPVDLEISRAVFEGILRESGLVEKSLEAVRRACQLAYVYENLKMDILLDAKAVVQFKLEDAVSLIDKVILVGGVTKIPYIRHRLETVFPGMIVDESVIEPVSAVAIGGSYPREPQHYSLSVPSYGFYLKAHNHVLQIFEPYEYYRFHETWTTSARPAHIKVIDLPYGLRNASLFYTKAESNKSVLHTNIGHMDAGRWKFIITVEGDMIIEMVGKKPRNLKPYPIIHPYQQVILDARDEKRKKAAQEQSKTKEEEIMDWFSEN
jgi:hypothetical protein